MAEAIEYVIPVELEAFQPIKLRIDEPKVMVLVLVELLTLNSLQVTVCPFVFKLPALRNIDKLVCPQLNAS